MFKTKEDLQQLVADRISIYGEDAIRDEIDERKYGYVDDDWDEEFESLDDAYAQYGQNDAETDVCYDHAYSVLPPDADDEDLALFAVEMLKQLGFN